jgi:hypothetical protein
MQWTINFFRHKADFWMDLMQATDQSGHRSYAAGQADLYQSFASEATEAFENVLHLG